MALHAGPWGAMDVGRAAEALAARLPAELSPLAALAYNYRWAWLADGEAVFRDISEHRWRLCGRNPVAMLTELPPGTVAAAARTPDLVRRVAALGDALETDLVRAPDGAVSPSEPVAFLCAEFGLHGSLPIYAGGLGVLAGDMLKEASDRGLPMVGVGLLYRQGYFRQRLDATGWQHEYWTAVDPDLLPTVLVTAADGRPLTVTVPLSGRTVTLQIWRVDVGRVPLFLLDAERPENAVVDRWITERLYVSDRTIRLRQYALLGVGGMRALDALGIRPAVVHLNEGHAALATIEGIRREVAAGASFDEACAAVRARTVFTTHTPVAAGNESYPAGDVLDVLPGHPDLDPGRILRLARVDPDDRDGAFGLSPLAIRMSRSTNGVSRRHGEVARAMWAPMYPGRGGDDVPVGHVTNGVHPPSWMAPPMRALLDRHLGEGWWRRAREPEVWAHVTGIPDRELWAVRSAQRAHLVAEVRERSVRDRLDRGEPLSYAVAAEQTFSDEAIIIGCARRIATYKRLHLLVQDAARAAALVGGAHPVQVVIAGKAHPQDEDAKRLVQAVFAMRDVPDVGRHVAFLEDYDMRTALHIVAGCDVWLNMPLPPQEASGTSGMKAALNGALNLSVLDGWWEEAWDGSNGWGVRSSAEGDPRARDAADAAELYRLLESEIVPLFHDRDRDGVPRGWLQKVRASLQTVGPRFCSGRMLADYVDSIYR